MFDKRRSYRCAVVGGRRQATLVGGGRRWPVQLLDQSAGGFGVGAPRSASWKTGTRLRLEYDGGVAEVRVAHVRPTPEGVRLGLERIADALPPEVGTEAIGWRWWRWEAGRKAPGQIVATIALFGLLSVAGGAFVWWRASGGQINPAPRPVRHGAVMVPPRRAAGPQRRPSGPARIAPPGARPNPAGAPASASPGGGVRGETASPLEPGAEAMRTAFARLAFLAAPRTVARLGLTAEQRRELFALLAEAGQRLQELSQRKLSPRRLEAATSLVVTGTEQRILAMLTVEQRRRWRELMEGEAQPDAPGAAGRPISGAARPAASGGRSVGGGGPGERLGS